MPPDLDPGIVAQVFGSDAPAVDPGSTPATEVPPAEPSKSPVPEKVAGRIAAGIAAEKRAAEARREREAAVTERDTAKKEADEFKSFLAKLRGNPVELLKAAGYSDVRQALEIIAGHREPDRDTTELDAVRKGQSDLAAEMKAFREEQAAARKASDDAQARQKSAEETAALHREVDDFVNHVGGGADYPTLNSDYTPSEIGNLALALVRQEGTMLIKRFGSNPSPEQVAGLLEERAAERAKARQEWAQRRSGSVPQSAAPSGPQVSRPTPRTLDDRMASERASGPREVDADEESLRILREALRRPRT